MGALWGGKEDEQDASRKDQLELAGLGKTTGLGERGTGTHLLKKSENRSASRVALMMMTLSGLGRFPSASGFFEFRAR